MRFRGCCCYHSHLAFLATCSFVPLSKRRQRCVGYLDHAQVCKHSLPLSLCLFLPGLLSEVRLQDRALLLVKSGEGCVVLSKPVLTLIPKLPKLFRVSSAPKAKGRLFEDQVHELPASWRGRPVEDWLRSPEYGELRELRHLHLRTYSLSRSSEADVMQSRDHQAGPKLFILCFSARKRR